MDGNVSKILKKSVFTHLLIPLNKSNNLSALIKSRKENNKLAL